MFAEEIAAICADLGLDPTLVSWEWLAKPYLKKSRRWTTWGTCTSLGGQRSRCRIATRREYREIIVTIAHELRHSWQYANGVLAHQGGKTVWSGTQYAGPKTYRAMRYWNRPQEIDARRYADDAWERLFQGQPAKQVETTEDITRRLVSAARRRR